MSIIPLSNNGKTPFEKLLGHAPEILTPWGNLEASFFNQTTFDLDFLEQIRRALAYSNQCRYCMAKEGPPTENQNDIRLRVALRFANQFAISHLSIDASEINQLKEYFSDSEIVELVAFCSFISASQRFGAVLGLEQSIKYSAI
jgi:alkylhydroperoxidase family enzyme